jgi:hypothetical protein
MLEGRVYVLSETFVLHEIWCFHVVAWNMAPCSLVSIGLDEYPAFVRVVTVVARRTAYEQNPFSLFYVDRGFTIG